MRRKIGRILTCAIALLFSTALAMALGSLLPDGGFVNALACAAPSGIVMLLCLHMIRLDEISEEQERILDLIQGVLDIMIRVAEDTEKLAKVVNEMAEKHK